MLKLYFKLKKHLKKRKGFTLVEILAVVVILGILITIAYPSVMSVMKSAQKDAIYDYSNQVFKKAQEIVMNGDFEFKYAPELEDTGFNLDLKYLELDNSGKYKGSIFYNNVTDELTIYVHDDKYMITNYTFENNTKKKEELIEEYYDTDSINNRFDHETICKAHEEVFICMYVDPNTYTLGFDINRIKDAGIIPYNILNGYPISIHDVIRSITKPGTSDGGDYVDNDAYNIDNVYNVKVVNTTSVPVPANAVDISPVQNGKVLSDLPTYLWFDSSSGTLYFGSATGEIDLYLACNDLFKRLSKVTSIDLKHFHFKYVQSISGMFRYCKSLLKVDLSGQDLSFVSMADGTFHRCISLGKAHEGNENDVEFGNWDTGYLEETMYMFNNCLYLKKIDVSKWDVSRVGNFEYMFCGCERLERLDVSNWNTKSAHKFDGLFQNCFKVKYLNVSNWNTSKVDKMVRMFCGDGELETLDVSKWDTRNLVDARFLFAGCGKIEELDVSNWDISNIEYIERMFAACQSLKRIVFGKTKNNKDLKLLENDVATYGQYGIGKVFYNCYNLEYVDMSNFEKFPDQPEYGYNMLSINTFLVSNSYTGDLNKYTSDYSAGKKIRYTLTKVG